MNDQLNNLDKAHFVKQGSDSRGPGVTSPPPLQNEKNWKDILDVIYTGPIWIYILI